MNISNMLRGEDLVKAGDTSVMSLQGDFTGPEMDGLVDTLSSLMSKGTEEMVVYLKKDPVVGGVYDVEFYKGGNE